MSRLHAWDASRPAWRKAARVMAFGFFAVSAILVPVSVVQGNGTGLILGAFYAAVGVVVLRIVR